MSYGYPSCSAPGGPTVKVTIPPGWFTYVAGLARTSVNQMTRMRVTNTVGTNTEHLIYTPKKARRTNEMMTFKRSREDSYSISARNDTQTLEFTSYYSTNPAIKEELLEETDAFVHDLVVLRANTPDHLHHDFPDYMTFFVFVQASPDQKDTEYTPLYNDAVCTINMIKGTGLNHDGFPLESSESQICHTAPGLPSQNGIPSGVLPVGRTTDCNLANGNFQGSAIDIAFVQDCTASLEPYIQTAANSIVAICSRISSAAKLTPDALRLGLVAFRDVGEEFVTKSFPFTSDVSLVKRNLESLVAEGGGDGPEAVTEALDAALSLDWRDGTTKMVVLITDAPPHGIGEPFDTMPTGSPSGRDPLIIVRQMAERGITLHLLACEPSMSTEFKYACDFYKALTKITNGLVFPLVSATGLIDAIVAASLERIQLNFLGGQCEPTIIQLAYDKQQCFEALVEEIHARYTSAGMKVTTGEVEPFYAEYPESVKNVDIYQKSIDVVSARPLSRVPGARILPKFAKQSLSPSVILTQKPISMGQTAQVIKLTSINNREKIDVTVKVPASEPYLARPTSEAPVKNSVRINVPAGWYGFVSALSRIKYNQVIKLLYRKDGNTNTEFMASRAGQKDNIMRVKRTKEEFYTFTASDSETALDISFFWSRDATKGSELAEDRFASQKLKVVQTQTPTHSLEHFPDYITYFIMAEDHSDAEQVAGVAEFNDCVCIINLIKNTYMVTNSS